MTITAQRIIANSNWRADSGLTSLEVATLMNEAAIRLVDNYQTLIGIQKTYGVTFASVMEYTMQSAIATIQSLPNTPENAPTKIQGVGMQQMLDALRIGSGPNFGDPATQAAIISVASVLDSIDPTTSQKLLSLGRVVDTSPITAEDVEEAWTYVEGYFTRQTTHATLLRLQQELGSTLEDSVAFASKLTEIKTIVAGL